MKTLILTLIVFLCIIGSINTNAYTPVRRPELSNLCVRSIGQDSYGHIWIATANGLCKKFGNEYEIYFGDVNDLQTVPSNSVTSLLLDSEGWLMVATNKGVCGLEKGSKIFHRFEEDDDPGSDFCGYGFVEYAGRLLCYGGNGLYEIDKNSTRMTLKVGVEGESLTSAIKGPDGLLWLSNGDSMMGVDSTLKVTMRLNFDTSSRIRTMAAAEKCLLLGTPNGVLSFNPANQSVTPTSIGSDTEVTYILTLDDGKHLVATSNRGVLVYDSATGDVSHKYGNIDFNELHADEINSVFCDKDKNIWVSTFDRGEVLLTDRQGLFNVDHNLINAFRNEFVTRIITGPHGNLWVGTRYKGIGVYNPQTKEKRYFNRKTSGTLHPFSHDFVQDMTFDSRGRLWAGYNNSLIVCDPVYTSSGEVTQVPVIKKFPFFVSVVSMAEDSIGQMWVGTDDSGLFVIDRDLNVMKTISTPLIRSNNITKILPYDSDHVLISAYSDNLYLINVRNMTVHNFDPSHQHEWNSAVDMMLDRDRNLWIGTYYHGLLRLDGKTRELTSCLGDQASDIVGLAQGPIGDIWASSSYGIYRFDPSGHQVNSYLKPDGLGGNQFHEKCATGTSQGKVLFGGNAGLEEVAPVEDKARFTPPIKLVLRGLWLLPDYKSVLTGTDLENIDEAAVDNVTLSHKDNSINIEYFAVNYDRAGDIQYAYMLKGREKDFIYTGNYDRVSYSDLSPGDYEFYVKARFKGKDWQEPVKLLDLTVKPNPWFSTPAILLYMLLALALIITANRLYLRFRLIKQKYALSEERITQEKRTTANRINFFTNISHELRTPLTLICGPAKYLKENHKNMSEAQIKESFEFIDSNVERLLTLINQLLSFRRVNNETLPLQVSKADMGAQLESLAKLYTFYATEHRVTINLEKPTNAPIMLTYDSDKVEKVVSNLIVNAIKYSGDPGLINLRLELVKHPAEFSESDDFTYAQISVSDNGCGMKDEDIPKIFQPFKRLLGIGNPSNTDGFGIGLHFVAHLVKEHKGIIRTVKNPSGGMTFTIVFPVSEEAFTPSEFKSKPLDVRPDNPVVAEAISETATAAPQMVDDEIDDPELLDDMETEEPRPKILVVDDNTSLNAFVASLFSDKYIVIQAYNGEDALQKATEECPDIIISDVLMPGDIDGLELCRRIKTDSSTSHIPVILLTAKILDEHKIEGYKCGADAYICKPFSPEVLIARVDNLNAKRSQQANLILASAGLSDQPLEQESVHEELSPLDKRFLEKLYAYIDNSLDNCDLNVNMLGRELGFSRTNFYRKVKALTGISPNDLLRVYRLNRAAELLLTREYTVGEVGEHTGFGNQSHFSSLFKKHFGVSPRAYVTNHFSQVSVTVEH